MESDGFLYDIFLSYRRREPDKSWVQNFLYPRLKTAGLKVCLDIHDFDLGKLIPFEMEWAVINSRYTVAVFTPKYLESQFTDLETLLSQHLSLMDANDHFLGIIREQCQLPLRHNAEQLFDMTDDSELDTPLLNLIQTIKVGVDKSTASPMIDEKNKPHKQKLKYDVFLINAPEDTAWVEEYLVSTLTAQGVRCQTRASFLEGDSLVQNIENAVRSSHLILPILSPAFLDDNLAMFAASIAISDDLHQQRYTVIPLILHAVESPLILSVFLGLDFTNPDDWAENIERLCYEVTRRHQELTPAKKVIIGQSQRS